MPRVYSYTLVALLLVATFVPLPSSAAVSTAQSSSLEKLTITVPKTTNVSLSAEITGPAALLRDIYARQTGVGSYSFSFYAVPQSPGANPDIGKYPLYMSSEGDMESPTSPVPANIGLTTAGFYQQIPVTPGKYRLEVRASKPMTKVQYGYTDFVEVARGVSDVFTFGNGSISKSETSAKKGSCTIRINKESVGAGKPFKVTWTTKGIKDAVLKEGILAGGTLDVKKKGTKTYREPAGTYQFAVGTGEDSSFVALCSATVRVTGTTPPSKSQSTSTSVAAATGKTIRAHIYEAAGSDHNFCYSKFGTVHVNVPKQSSPVVLSLAAYEPVNWVVKAADSADIQKVVLGGYNPQSVTGLPKNIPVEEKTFYSLKRASSVSSTPGQGVFVDTRDSGTIYHGAGDAYCANSSGKVPLKYRAYLTGQGGYVDVSYGNNYSASTITAQ